MQNRETCGEKRNELSVGHLARLEWKSEGYAPFPVSQAEVGSFRLLCKSSRAGKSICFRNRHIEVRFPPPSQTFQRSARLPKRLGNGPEIAAFRIFRFVSGHSVGQTQGENGEKSPALSGNIPVLGRLSAEKGSIGTAARERQLLRVAETILQAIPKRTF